MAYLLQTVLSLPLVSANHLYERITTSLPSLELIRLLTTGLAERLEHEARLLQELPSELLASLYCHPRSPLSSLQYPKELGVEELRKSVDKSSSTSTLLQSCSKSLLSAFNRDRLADTLGDTVNLFVGG